jgi:hypothetical protein
MKIETQKDLADLIESGTMGRFGKICQVDPRIMEKLFKSEQEIQDFCKQYGYRANNGRLGLPLSREFFFRDFCRDWYKDGNIERSWQIREEWEQNKHMSNTWKNE